MTAMFFWFSTGVYIPLNNRCVAATINSSWVSILNKLSLKKEIGVEAMGPLLGHAQHSISEACCFPDV